MWSKIIKRQIPLTQLRGNHFNAVHLSKCQANYAPLTPLSTFRRTVSLYPTKPAYVYEDVQRNWKEVGGRVSSFASALLRLGIQRGDVVSVMAPNIPAMYEAHFAVPGIGAVLHSINTRLDATSIAYQLNHSEAKVVLVDVEFSVLNSEVKNLLSKDSNRKLPIFISINDPTFTHPPTANSTPVPSISEVEYEDFIKTGDANFQLLPCVDEWDAISLNYTSGTTGNPKGVVFHSRGAYLNTISNIVEWNMEKFDKFLCGEFSIMRVVKLVLFNSLLFFLLSAVLYCFVIFFLNYLIQFLNCLCFFSGPAVSLQWLDVPLDYGHGSWLFVFNAPRASGKLVPSN